ncbi:MAG TPA: glycosyltransferase [Cytophaga sp.]|nr:glycosyltransferase [Cytophaga sp.]
MNSQSFIEILFYTTGILSIGYLVFIAITIASHKQPVTAAATNEGVSIIIAAHNEYENLRAFLPSILDQSYPDFEVIVACDRCTDDSVAFLTSLHHPALRIIEIHTLSDSVQPKKAALTQAIQLAKNPWILVSDADCYPVSNQWINKMICARNDKTICPGISLYIPKPGFLNAFIRFETILTALQYSAWALLGRPYMGVGRNLLYAKELFINNNGFGKQANHLGGDDDLFIQNIATNTNTSLSTDPASFTLSKPAEGYRQWWKQKHRHLHAGKQYPFGILLGLSIYPVLSAIFHFICIYYLIGLNFEPILAFYILRTCIFISIFARIGYKWNNKQPIFFLAITEIVYLIYLLFAGIYNLAVPIKKWK